MVYSNKVIFNKQTRVRFAHCDPAGIIFYPRFFEILNAIIEDWFLEAVDCSFRVMLDDHNLGAPMVDVHAEFLNPCFLDDQLDFKFWLTALGKSSASFTIEGRVEKDLKIKACGVLVCAQKDLGSSHPWPDFMKVKMAAYLQS